MRAAYASMRVRLCAIASTSCVVAQIVAAASSPDDINDGTPACVVSTRAYLWVSSAFVLLAGAIAAFYAWTKKQKNHKDAALYKLGLQMQQIRLLGNPKTLCCLLLWVGCVLMAGWGVAGVALSTSDDDCSAMEQKNGLVALSIVVASSCVLGSGVLLLKAIFAMIQMEVPGQEAPPAIVCLRCSCCSQVLKRVLLLAPAVLLASVNFVSWHESQSFERQCHSSASTFFGGAALIFLIMALVQLASYSVTSKTLCQRKRNTPSSSPRLPSTTAIVSTPLASRITTKRYQRLVVLGGLLVLSLSCIAWASLGWLWSARSNSNKPTKCMQPSSVLRSMSVSIVLLFLIGWVLLTLTFCCRLEDFIITLNSETPTVEVSALSPRLIHSLRAASPAPAHDQLRRGSLTTASDTVV